MDPVTSQKTATPASPQNSKIKTFLARTSSAFVAEYSLLLITLGLALSNLSWLVYTFFGLVVTQMHAGSMAPSYVSTKLFALWLLISSVVVLPIVFVLWRRTQGELAENKELKGELRGGARGFRTFWLVLSGLGMLRMLMAALFAPIAAFVEGAGFAEMLLGVTLPSLINIGVMGIGVYLVTRQTNQPGKSPLLLGVVAGLTVILFIASFVWSMNLKTSESYPRPYRAPAPSADPYQDIYDPYYDYNY